MGALFLRRLIPPMIFSLLGAYQTPLTKQRMTPATQPIENPFPKSSTILQGQGCSRIAMASQPELYHNYPYSTSHFQLQVQNPTSAQKQWCFHLRLFPIVTVRMLPIIKISKKMQKRPIGYQVGKPSILDVKIPKTSKYDHVESKLAGKTGTTAKDIEFMTNKEVSKKKGELFRRIKPSTVWKLLNQEEKSQSIYNWNKPEQDAVSQTSNLTSITIKTEQLPTGIDTDFLLVDFREPEEYDKYHIKQALNFPGPRIKQDKFMPQMFNYKNKENKIIIVYHFDEKPGMEYSTQLAEKGYDNLYLLSGGIEGFGQEIQEGLEGKDVPLFKKKEEVRKFKKQRAE